MINKVIKENSAFIKWTGSKRKIANKIFQYFPSKINNYYEPFLGGGYLLYLFKKNNPNKCAYGSDIYNPLIKLFKILKNKPYDLIENYSDNWNKLQKDFPNYFYKVRERFNKNNNPFDLFFLSRTCANGIIRFNSNNQFNNSIHLSRKGINPEKIKSTILDWSNNFSKKTFFNTFDFNNLLNKLKMNDFVYLDPPYYGSKNRYIQNLDFEDFVIFLKNLNKKRIKWALSFDGSRSNYQYANFLDKNIYKRKIYIKSGYSAISKVLNKNLEKVTESLYLNY